MTTKIIVLRGLPGSGKSYWSKNYMNSFPAGEVIRTNKDDLRLLLHDGRWDGNKTENQVIEVRNTIIEMALSRSKIVIVDDTNFHEKHLAHMYNIANKYNAEVEIEIKDFTDVPLALCIERDSQRAKPVGKKVIMDMYNRYLKEGANDS